MNTIFAQTARWKTYDVFARKKMSTFRSSRPSVLELAARYRDMVTELESKHTLGGAQSGPALLQAEKLLFAEMCDVCLWGNATDLGLRTNMSYEDIQQLQGAQARKASQEHVVVNDCDKAFAVLSAAAQRQRGDATQSRRVDIILDNAGFELFVDLVLAGYLLAAGLATAIVLHPKSIPWFVSDVVPSDFAALLSAMADPGRFLHDTLG